MALQSTVEGERRFTGQFTIETGLPEAHKVNMDEKSRRQKLYCIRVTSLFVQVLYATVITLNVVRAVKELKAENYVDGVPSTIVSFAALTGISFVRNFCNRGEAKLNTPPNKGCEKFFFG